MEFDPKEPDPRLGQAIAKILGTLAVSALLAGMIPPHLQERAGIWIGTLYQSHIKPGGQLLSGTLLLTFSPIP